MAMATATPGSRDSVTWSLHIDALNTTINRSRVMMRILNASEVEKSDGIASVSNVITVLTIIISVTGAFGNLFTVIAVLTTSQLRHNTNSVLICNLSLADGFFCAVLLPLQAVTFDNEAWLFGDLPCVLYGAVSNWLYSVTMALLCCIAFYRYLHILHKKMHTYLSLSPWLPIAIAACWTLSAALPLTAMTKAWGHYSFRKEVLQCLFVPYGNYSITFLTIEYAITFAFMTMCYSRVCCFVYAFNIHTSTCRDATLFHMKELSRTPAMVLLVFFGFFIGITPSVVVQLGDPELRLPIGHVITTMMVWTLFSMTPVIYTLIDTKLHTAYRRLLLLGFQAHRQTRTTTLTLTGETISALSHRFPGRISNATTIN